MFVLHGDWKVRSNETSATAGPSAFKFLGGCAAHHSFRCPTAGESTSSTRERAREKGMEADLAVASARGCCHPTLAEMDTYRASHDS